MRMAVALALVSASLLSLAEPAHAFSLDVPRLTPPSFETLATAGVPDDLFFATPSLVVPPRYDWVVEDGRAFWYSAGASAVVALGTHVLVGLPVTVITLMSTSTLLSAAPAMYLPVLLGVGSAYLLGQSAVAAAAAWMVFNGTSDVYQTNYLTSLAAHVGGTIVGAGVSVLTFGLGGLLFGGLTTLAEFTGSAGITAIGVFSLLGSLPAVVIGGIALVGAPALIGVWALAVTAEAKEGYSIDRQWRAAPALAPAAPVARGDAPALPIANLALPAP